MPSLSISLSLSSYKGYNDIPTPLAQYHAYPFRDQWCSQVVTTSMTIFHQPLMTPFEWSSFLSTNKLI